MFLHIYSTSSTSYLLQLPHNSWSDHQINIWFQKLVIKIFFIQFSRDVSRLISVRPKYYFQLYVTKYSLFFFLKHAENKADNMYVPGCTPTQVLQAKSEQNNERFI
jgi:hypothetical protein